MKNLIVEAVSASPHAIVVVVVGSMASVRAHRASTHRAILLVGVATARTMHRRTGWNVIRRFVVLYFLFLIFIIRICNSDVVELSFPIFILEKMNSYSLNHMKTIIFLFFFIRNVIWLQACIKKYWDFDSYSRKPDDFPKTHLFIYIFWKDGILLTFFRDDDSGAASPLVRRSGNALVALSGHSAAAFDPLLDQRAILVRHLARRFPDLKGWENLRLAEFWCFKM